MQQRRRHTFTIRISILMLFSHRRLLRRDRASRINFNTLERLLFLLARRLCFFWRVVLRVARVCRRLLVLRVFLRAVLRFVRLVFRRAMGK